MRFLSTLAASFLGTLLGLGLLFLFGLMFVFALASTSEQAPSVRTGTILVAELGGNYPEMVSGDPIAQAFGGESRVDMHDVIRAMRMAAVDDRIDGVWLRMGDLQTPWANLEAIRRAIEDTRAAGKTVIASSDIFYMGEDELYLASAADSILLDPESMFEFNGFAMQTVFLRGLFDKAGINPQAVRAGQFKSAVETYTRKSMSEANKLQLSEIVADMESTLVNAISVSRGLGSERVGALLDAGNILSARDALEAGLIDGLAFADEVESVFGNDPRTISLVKYAQSSARTAGIPQGSDGEIAVVYAEGTMVAASGNGLQDYGSAAITPERFARAMTRAREDDDVDAIVLRINSPGGFAPAADAMLREIQLTVAQKPVIVSMGSMAASGGYWIAAAADTIVAERLTWTGSIGVFGLVMDVSSLLEDHLGVTIDGVQTGPSADMMGGFRSMTPAERANLGRSMDRTYDQFLALVAEGRGMTVEEVHAVAQGRVWTGTDARDAGLVDVLGGLETALDLAAERVGLAKGSYRVTELPRPQTFLDRFTKSLEARVMGPTPRALGLLLPPAAAVAYGSLLDALSLQHGVYALLPLRMMVN
ncbi:MAG: protease-4 [Rhodothermales bacterium]|jgi:protease-4